MNWIPDKHWPAFRRLAITYLATLVLALGVTQAFSKDDTRRTGGGGECYCVCGCGGKDHGPIQQFFTYLSNLIFNS